MASIPCLATTAWDLFVLESEFAGVLISFRLFRGGCFDVGLPKIR